MRIAEENGAPFLKDIKLPLLAPGATQSEPCTFGADTYDIVETIYWPPVRRAQRGTMPVTGMQAIKEAPYTSFSPRNS